MPRINVKDTRKQQLIEANIASMAKRGYADTTITHVSQGAGMSRGIVNFYFTTKEAMMLATLKYLAAEFGAMIEAAAAKAHTPEEQLTRIIAEASGRKWCNPKRLGVWLAFVGHAGTHKDYRHIITRMIGDFTETLKTACKKIYGKEAAGHAALLAQQVQGGWLAGMFGAPCDVSAFPAAALPIVQPKRLAQGTAANTRSAPRKKPAAVSDGQLDFGELFSVKK